VVARTIVIIALATLVIGLTLPNIWLPHSRPPPIGTDDNFNVVSLTPGRLADDSGLRIGDHIEAKSLTLFERLEVWDGFSDPGAPLVLKVDRGGRTYSATIPMVVNEHGVLWYGFLKRTTATAFIVVAAILLIRRPSTMLWGFFLYALGSANSVAHVAYLVSPLAMGIMTIVLECIYIFLAPLGLLLFSTRFPIETSTGLRGQIQRLTPWLAVLLLLPIVELLCIATGVGFPPALGKVSLWVQPVVLTIGMIALVSGFLQLEPSQRQRLRWVVAGFSIFYAAVVYYQFSYLLPGGGWPASWTNAGWYVGLVNCTVVLIPITVAYAVLKHKVLDIRFVIGRGIVYGILTSIAVAVFAIIDWIAHSVIAQSGLALAGDIAAAVAIGFWLNTLHGGVNRFVDAVIFRQRHLAEQRLERAAVGLPHALDEETVAQLVVREPVSALNLLSGAFLRRIHDNTFRCIYAEGMPTGTELRLSASDPLFVHLYGERGPVILRHIEWRAHELADGPHEPAVAFPLFVRQELTAVALFGEHASGEAIDPDEMRLLRSLCVGASAALDHLEADALRRENEALRRELAMPTSTASA
jgi:hypothetical protein